MYIVGNVYLGYCWIRQWTRLRTAYQYIRATLYWAGNYYTILQSSCII